MRQCKIASVCRLPGHPCCVDCKDRTCEDRCMNLPARCGCCEDLDPRPNRSLKSKIDRQELLRLHKQGLLQREIAQRLGCSASTVCTILRGIGVRRYG